MNRSDAPYRLLGFDVSYFTGKVRPALRYKGLWFEERRVQQRELRERTGLGFIPVVVTPDDETWQDSTEILHALEARHPEPPLFPTSPLLRLLGQLVELYVDEFALIPAMHYRWGSERGEQSARARFSAMVGSVKLGNLAADQMVAARFAVGAAADAGPEIEAHTHDLLDALGAHVDANPGAYLLGDRMSFADCALMGPLYAHLFVDLVSRELLLDRAVPVVSWIERCNVPHSDEMTTWFPADGVPASLWTLLGVMGRDAAPLLLDVERALEAWADEQGSGLADEPPPRSIGLIPTALRGRAIQRMGTPYLLYSLQQAREAWHALSDAERATISQELDESGWLPLLAHDSRHRVSKQDFALVFER